MPAGSARTGTVGDGEQDGPARGPWTGLQPRRRGRVSGTVGLARWARRPAKLHLPAQFACRTSPSLQPAVAAVPPAGLPVPAWLTWHHGAVVGHGWDRRAAARSIAVPTALRQTRLAGVRAGRGTDRETCVSCARCGPPRVPRLPARRATGPVVTTPQTSTSGTGWGRHRAFCVTPSEVIHSCGRLCGDKSQPCNIPCLTALKASSRSGPGEATHVRRRLLADVSLLRVLSLAARRPGEPAGSLTRRGRRPHSAVG